MILSEALSYVKNEEICDKLLCEIKMQTMRGFIVVGATFITLGEQILFLQIFLVYQSIKYVI